MNSYHNEAQAHLNHAMSANTYAPEVTETFSSPLNNESRSVQASSTYRDLFSGSLRARSR